MNLPEGFEQMDIFESMDYSFDASKKKAEEPKKKKQKGVIYRCPKCGILFGEGVPIVVAFCACGRRMEREETK